MHDVAWARELARELLEEPLPRRWRHSQGVAAKAESVSSVVGENADLLVCSAWLHDVGYSPNLAVTGFHPLDGGDLVSVDARLSEILGRYGDGHLVAG